MSLTGNKNLDYEILYKLSDKDLGNMCATNKYTRDLCRNDTFWMNRTFKRFAPVFGNWETIKEYKERYKFNTWRNYYIDLVNNMEKYYEDLEDIKKYLNKLKREDIYILIQYIEDNSNKYLVCYMKDINCKLDLTRDFINLNHVLENVIGSLRENRDKIDVLDQFFSLDNFQINEANIEFLAHVLKDEGIEKLLNSKQNNINTRKIFLNLILLDSKNFNIDISPYIKNFKEILDVLFTIIRDGFYLYKTSINDFLILAVKKGATEKDIQKYYEKIKTPNEYFGKDEMEKYNTNMKIVKKFIKNMKKSNISDKLGKILDKLKQNKYSDDIYDKILKLL